MYYVALKSSVAEVSSPSVTDHCLGVLHQGIASAIKPDAALKTFLDIKAQIETSLKENNPQNLLEQCRYLMASDQHNIPFFPTDVMERLRQETQSPALLQKLSPYFTWADHSFLNEIVTACHNPIATELITQYDANLDTSQPLLDYPIA